jgi:hypothetical protein
MPTKNTSPQSRLTTIAPTFKGIVALALVLYSLQGARAERKPTPRACLAFCEAAEVRAFRACVSCCTSQRLRLDIEPRGAGVEISARALGWTTERVELLATRTDGVACTAASIRRGTRLSCRWVGPRSDGVRSGSLFVVSSHGVRGVFLARGDGRSFVAMEMELCRLKPNSAIDLTDLTDSLKHRWPALCRAHPGRQRCSVEPVRPVPRHKGP